MRNTATVAVPAGMGDPNPANNSATDDDVLLCFGETVVVPDGRLTASTIGAGATTWFAASLKVGSSYSLEFKNATGSGTPPGVLTVFSGDDACSGVSTLATNDTAGTDPAGTPGTARVSFTATGGGELFPGEAGQRIGIDDPVYVRAVSASLSGTLTLLDTTGSVLATFNIMVPAGQTAGTNTAALGVTRNRTGTARFTHDGPPGALVIEAAIANFSISPPYVQPVKFEAVREAR